MNENELSLEVRQTAGREIAVTDQASYELAAGFAKSLKEKQKQVKDFFAEPKQKAYEAHKSISAKERELLAPLEEAERLVKNKMGAFMLAEQKRIEAEEQRKREETERLTALAVEAEQAGDSELAAEATTLAALESVNVTYIPKSARDSSGRVAGISSRKAWKFRIVDEAKVPREWLTVNEAAIAGLARSFKDKPTMTIPGIEFFPEVITSIR